MQIIFQAFFIFSVILSFFYLEGKLIPNEEGSRYKFFQPDSLQTDNQMTHARLLASPSHWVHVMEQEFIQLDRLVSYPGNSTIKERAVEAYAQFMINALTGVGFGDAEPSVHWKVFIEKFNATNRERGLDWPYLGVTMVGKRRLLNIFDLIHIVVKEKVQGAFLEAGVWRGGGSIFAASLFQARQETNRAVILCDSFHGLPPGNEKFHKKDVGWDHKPYLEVSDQIVARNFHKYGVLTDHVYFVKGFFNDSLPHLAPVLSPNSISILRMDGDMYQSTVDILYHLYDKLSVGGYVIVDDWTNFPAKIAVEDFFECHKISPEVIAIDDVSVYFKKAEKIEVQRWRYEKNLFKPTDVQ